MEVKLAVDDAVKPGDIIKVGTKQYKITSARYVRLGPRHSQQRIWRLGLTDDIT